MELVAGAVRVWGQGRPAEKASSASDCQGRSRIRVGRIAVAEAPEVTAVVAGTASAVNGRVQRRQAATQPLGEFTPSLPGAAFLHARGAPTAVTSCPSPPACWLA